MRLIQTIATFIVALLAIGMVVELATGGTLGRPDPDPARLMVWGGILIGAGLAAWWRWSALGRSAAPAAERASASPPAPRLKSEEIEATVSDRLGRISQRGRQMPVAAAAPMPETTMPPALDEPPQPFPTPEPFPTTEPEPEPEPYPAPDAFPEDPMPAPPVEEPPQPSPTPEPVPAPDPFPEPSPTPEPFPAPEPFPQEEPEPVAPPSIEEPPLPEPTPDELPPLELTSPEEEPAAEMMAPPPDLPQPDPMAPPPDMPIGGPMFATKRTRSNTGGLSPIGAGDPDEEEEEEPEEEEEDYEEEEEEEDEDFEEPEDEEAAAEPAMPEQPAQPEPPEPVVEPVLAEGGRTAILLRQQFPPPHDGSLSFFGGMPIASPGFAWPRAEGGAPFSFLMQVDCAALPAHARMGMPDRGILYFFMDLTWGQQDAWRVVHEDVPTGDLMEIVPPDDLPPAFGDQAKYVWKWPRTGEESPRLLPKWPFRPQAIVIPPDAWGDLGEENGDEDDVDPRLIWPHGNAIAQILAAAQGEEIGPDWLTIKDFAAADGGLIRPFANYPHDARAIQIMAGTLLERLEGPMRGQIRVPDHDSVAEEDRNALLDKIAGEAREWYADAALEPPFIEVPQEFADQFWQWLSSFPWLSRMVMQDALTQSMEESLTASAEAAARVPPEVARRIRHRHALAVHTDTGIHANTPERMLAPPVDVQGNQYERAQSHILLFEMASNEGLGHHFGEGVYQFWITPEDLQAGRFDKVVLTADAY